jgi:AcrR family transcriptional regulator
VTTRLSPAHSAGTIVPLNEPTAKVDRRAERRASRREQSRTEILDAAETVFGEDGIRDGSLRRIAELSGFSAAALYLFFEDKQQILAETLTRRADEWNSTIQGVAEGDSDPLEKLHEIIDASTRFFDERPQFRLLLRHIRGGPAVTGPALAEFATEVDGRYFEILKRVATIVKDGQSAGRIRKGNERSIAHLYSVMVNEFVLLATSSAEANVGTLTAEEFHDFVDGALRAPSAGSQKS